MAEDCYVRNMIEHDIDSDSSAERMRLMRLAVDFAEKLDELERRLDPDGPPPRHAALAYRRLRGMTQEAE